jgi:hypothetical protein
VLGILEYKINDFAVLAGLAGLAVEEVKDFPRIFPLREAQCHRQKYHQITDVI